MKVEYRDKQVVSSILGINQVIGVVSQGVDK